MNPHVFSRLLQSLKLLKNWKYSNVRPDVKLFPQTGEISFWWDAVLSHRNQLLRDVKTAVQQTQ